MSLAARQNAKKKEKKIHSHKQTISICIYRIRADEYASKERERRGKKIACTKCYSHVNGI